MTMKKGFTLLEMMAVIAIVGILIGMVVSAATSALRSEREQRAEALKAIIKEGIESYHAQKDEWPGVDLTQRTSAGTLSAAETKAMIYEVVKETLRNNNPLLDVSELFVMSENAYQENRESGWHNGVYRKASMYGMPFMEAARRKSNAKKRTTHIPVSQMIYGYPDAKDGSFKRFKISYNPPTDSIEVYK